MSRPDLINIAERVSALGAELYLSDADLDVLSEAGRALVYAQREIDYLEGARDGAQKSLDVAIRRLASVTGALWPGPYASPDGGIFDGTDAMKIKAHDAARELSKMPMKAEDWK